MTRNLRSFAHALGFCPEMFKHTILNNQEIKDNDLDKDLKIFFFLIFATFFLFFLPPVFRCFYLVSTCIQTYNSKELSKV